MSPRRLASPEYHWRQPRHKRLTSGTRPCTHLPQDPLEQRTTRRDRCTPLPFPRQPQRRTSCSNMKQNLLTLPTQVTEATTMLHFGNTTPVHLHSPLHRRLTSGTRLSNSPASRKNSSNQSEPLETTCPMKLRQMHRL